jgi:hypothetical protein
MQPRAPLSLPAIAATVLCGTVALFGSGEGQAQEVEASLADARRDADGFANCVIRGSKRSWAARLDEPFGTPQSILALRKAVEDQQDCVMGGVARMRFPPLLLRGLIYEALYTSDNRGKPEIASFEGVEPILYPFPGEDSIDVAGQYRAMMTLGDCVVRHAPAEAHALLLTRVESSKEKASFPMLMPALRSCVQEGVTLKLNRSTVRAALAEPMYRLTAAARAAQLAKAVN